VVSLSGVTSTLVSWTDPQAVTANAAGQLTDAQLAMLAGRPQRRWHPVRWLRQRLRLARLRASPVSTGVGRVLVRPHLHLPPRPEDPWFGVWIVTVATEITAPPGAPDPPAPGRYLLSWVTDRGMALLLSAEPIGGAGDPPSPETGVALLAAAGCREEDLTHNRAGLLTGPQHRTIRRRARLGLIDNMAWNAFYLVLPVSLVAVCGGSAVVGALDGRASGFILGAFALLGGLGVFTMAWLLVREAIDEWRSDTAPLRRDAPVGRSTGEIVMTGRGRIEFSDPLIVIDPPNAVIRILVLEPGRYTVYWYDGSDPYSCNKILLSAEPAAARADFPGL
jgi:hypothetical protein